MKIRRNALAWAFYDWANSAFATSVIAGFFPIFFKQYWNVGVDVSVSTFRLGVANSLGSLLLIVSAPILGAMADRMGARKKFLCFFALLGVLMTGSFYFIPQGSWLAAMLLFILAYLGFAGANIFYDALLPEVAEPQDRDRISSLGFALGYLGGGLLLALNIWMTLRPAFFGLTDSSEAVRYSFLSVALWWAIFTIPIMTRVKEKKIEQQPTLGAAVRGGCSQLYQTFKEIRRLRTVMFFLLGYWLYIDGVGTIIHMAVDYGLSLGFNSNNLIVALLLTQFTGFPAAILFGRLGEKMGTKKAILIGIGVYAAITVWAVFMKSAKEFYILAVCIGLVQGGVQALSRSLFSRIIPAGRAAEFFGFYNMLGKAATVFGPIFMGWVSLMTGSPRLSILSIIVFFVAGGLLLLKVDEEEGMRLAAEME